MNVALRIACFAVGVAAVSALPLAGRALRTGGVPRCALDGVALRPATTVTVAESGVTRRLCCVDCATAWLRRAGESAVAVSVADETTGRDMAVGDVWFVRSRVPSNPDTGCRVHAFAAESDAKAHADAYGGTLLTGRDRPLRVRE